MSSATSPKLYTLQPEHEFLRRFAGEWEFEKKSAPSDGSAPQKVGSGEMKAESLGGFFVVCRWSGNVHEIDFSALQTLGYDIENKEYSGCWVDSLMSFQWQFSGQFKPKLKELVLSAVGPNPNGGTTKFRECYQFDATDSITVEAEMLQEEKWVTFRTTHLARKTKEKSD